MKIMTSSECVSKLSPICFWDVNPAEFDMDAYPGYIIPRVLEVGTLDDWRLVQSYYGLDKIAEVCKRVRSLDPVSLAFICAITHTNKEDYRCYHFSQLSPALWNS
jgi:hypothetical protein